MRQAARRGGFTTAASKFSVGRGRQGGGRGSGATDDDIGGTAAASGSASRKRSFMRRTHGGEFVSPKRSSGDGAQGAVNMPRSMLDVRQSDAVSARDASDGGSAAAASSSRRMEDGNAIARRVFEVFSVACREASAASRQKKNTDTIDVREQDNSGSALEPLTKTMAAVSREVRHPNVTWTQALGLFAGTIVATPQISKCLAGCDAAPAPLPTEDGSDLHHHDDDDERKKKFQHEVSNLWRRARGLIAASMSEVDRSGHPELAMKMAAPLFDLCQQVLVFDEMTENGKKRTSMSQDGGGEFANGNKSTNENAMMYSRDSFARLLHDAIARAKTTTDAVERLRTFAEQLERIRQKQQAEVGDETSVSQSSGGLQPSGRQSEADMLSAPVPTKLYEAMFTFPSLSWREACAVLGTWRDTTLLPTTINNGKVDAEVLPSESDRFPLRMYRRTCQLLLAAGRHDQLTHVLDTVWPRDVGAFQQSSSVSVWQLEQSCHRTRLAMEQLQLLSYPTTNALNTDEEESVPPMPVAVMDRLLELFHAACTTVAEAVESQHDTAHDPHTPESGDSQFPSSDDSEHQQARRYAALLEAVEAANAKLLRQHMAVIVDAACHLGDMQALTYAHKLYCPHTASVSGSSIGSSTNPIANVLEHFAASSFFEPRHVVNLLDATAPSASEQPAASDVETNGTGNARMMVVETCVPLVLQRFPALVRRSVAQKQRHNSVASLHKGLKAMWVAVMNAAREEVRDKSLSIDKESTQGEEGRFPIYEFVLVHFSTRRDGSAETLAYFVAMLLERGDVRKAVATYHDVQDQDRQTVAELQNFRRSTTHQSNKNKNSRATGKKTYAKRVPAKMSAALCEALIEPLLDLGKHRLAVQCFHQALLLCLGTHPVDTQLRDAAHEVRHKNRHLMVVHLNILELPAPEAISSSDSALMNRGSSSTSAPFAWRCVATRTGGTATGAAPVPAAAAAASDSEELEGALQSSPGAGSDSGELEESALVHRLKTLRQQQLDAACAEAGIQDWRSFRGSSDGPDDGGGFQL